MNSTFNLPKGGIDIAGNVRHDRGYSVVHEV